MTLAKLAIDTGYESAAVYAWSRKQGIAHVAPVKGLEGFNRATPVSGPTFVDATVNGRKLKRGARLWNRTMLCWQERSGISGGRQT